MSTSRVYCGLIVAYVLDTYRNGANIRDVRGIDLRVERTKRRVTVSDLARVMGYKNHSSISHLERLAVVPQSAAAKYLAALTTFPVVDEAA